jgi:hypothetical protein
MSKSYTFRVRLRYVLVDPPSGWRSLWLRSHLRQRLKPLQLNQSELYALERMRFKDVPATHKDLQEGDLFFHPQVGMVKVENQQLLLSSMDENGKTHYFTGEPTAHERSY